MFHMCFLTQLRQACLLPVTSMPELKLTQLKRNTNTSNVTYNVYEGEAQSLLLTAIHCLLLTAVQSTLTLKSGWQRVTQRTLGTQTEIVWRPELSATTNVFMLPSDTHRLHHIDETRFAFKAHQISDLSVPARCFQPRRFDSHEEQSILLKACFVQLTICTWTYFNRARYPGQSRRS